MEKLDTCTRLSRKLRLSRDTCKPYHSILVHQQYIGKKIQVVFILLNLKELLLELNTLTFLSVSYKNNLTMVSLFQNMINIVSYRQICAPNHVHVQLSVGEITGWLDSYYIQTVIQNTTKSWYYTSLLLTKRITNRTYYEFTRKPE